MFGFVLFGIIAIALYVDTTKPLFGLTSPAIWSMGLALFVLLLDAHSFTDERKRRLLKLVVASLIVIAGLAAQQQQDHFNNARVEFENEITKKNNEIAQKSDKLAAVTREIAFLTTGGDSYPLVALLFPVDAPNRPSLVVFHKGRYPLNNIQVAVVDYEQYKKVLPNIPRGKENAKPATLDDLEKVDKLRLTFDVGAMGPGAPMTVLRRDWKLPSRDKVTYNIQISTQFRIFYEHMKLQKVNGRWTIAHRVHTHGTKEAIEVLDEKIPANFPREKAETFNWEYE
jgi:hypothetical protein